MKQSDDNKIIPMTSVSSGQGKEVADDVFYYTDQIVNLIMIGKPGDRDWVLVDAGMPGSGEQIAQLAAERFLGHPPIAIILTHGHFDHVGSLVYLLERWPVPVFAHPLEFPFLTGKQAYPEPDTSVEGGILAKISSIYPNQPIDVTEVLNEVGAGGVVPHLPEWQWIHVPGHSPGQIALYRAKDGILLSADAFVTVRQDSLYKVLIQKEEVNGPPRYLTTDWKAAYESVKRLAQLRPRLVVAGHGQFMHADELDQGLKKLVEEFQDLAVPDYGKFVEGQS